MKVASRVQKPGAKARGAKLAQARARREADNVAGGGRYRIDVSERELTAPTRLNTTLRGATAAVNAQLQTPESWRALWEED